MRCAGLALPEPRRLGRPVAHDGGRGDDERPAAGRDDRHDGAEDVGVRDGGDGDRLRQLHGDIAPLVYSEHDKAGFGAECERLELPYGAGVPADAASRAAAQYRAADNMTDRQGALAALLFSGSALAEPALALLTVFRHRNYRLFFAGQAISLVLPLNDFAKAYDGPPTDPKTVADQQKQLQDELQKRAIVRAESIDRSAARSRADAPSPGPSASS